MWRGETVSNVLPPWLVCRVVQPLPNGTGNGGSALTNIITEVGSSCGAASFSRPPTLPPSPCVQIPIAWEVNPTPTTMIGNFNGAPGVTSWTDYTVSAVAAFGAAPPAPPTPPVVQVENCTYANAQLWQPVGGSLPSQIAIAGDNTLCLGVGSQDPHYAALSAAVVPCNSTAAVVWSLDATTSQLKTPDGLCADVLSVSTTLLSCQKECAARYSRSSCPLAPWAGRRESGR